MALLREAVILMLLMLSVVLIRGQSETISEPDKTTPCVDDKCSGIEKPVTPVSGSEGEILNKTAPSTIAANTPEPTKAPTTIFQTTAAPKAPAKVRKPKDYYDSSEFAENDDEDDSSSESDAGVITIWIKYVEPAVTKPPKRKTKKPSKAKKDAPLSNTQMNFPLQHYSNPKEFPLKSLDSLVAIAPWLPIFYDNSTFQTIIFSPSGGIYVMPPLMNFYGQRFSVAQLIKWGYVTLDSDGTPPGTNLDVAANVQSAPQGTNYGPTYDARIGGFDGSVRTPFGHFPPQYNSALYGPAKRK